MTGLQWLIAALSTIAGVAIAWVSILAYRRSKRRDHGELRADDARTGIESLNAAQSGCTRINRYGAISEADLAEYKLHQHAGQLRDVAERLGITNGAITSVVSVMEQLAESGVSSTNHDTLQVNKAIKRQETLAKDLASLILKARAVFEQNLHH
jgi:hypothetical protein